MSLLLGVSKLVLGPDLAMVRLSRVGSTRRVGLSPSLPSCASCHLIGYSYASCHLLLCPFWQLLYHKVWYRSGSGFCTSGTSVLMRFLYGQGKSRVISTMLPLSPFFRSNSSCIKKGKWQKRSAVINSLDWNLKSSTLFSPIFRPLNEFELSGRNPLFWNLFCSHLLRFELGVKFMKYGWKRSEPHLVPENLNFPQLREHFQSGPEWKESIVKFLLLELCF